MPVRCMAYRLFGSVSALVEPRSFRGLPVLVHVVSQRARVLRLRRAGLPLAINATGRVAFPSRETVGDPGSQTFRSSIARPTDALVYASTETSRRQSQDSGSRWSSLSPFLYDSFIRYNMPVHPGAPPGACGLRTFRLTLTHNWRGVESIRLSVS